LAQGPRGGGRLALELGRDLELPSGDRLELELTARLHDVGKQAIPYSILNKPASLSASEWAVMRRHPEWGGDMLAEVPGLDAVAQAVHCHHERWDGGGYRAASAARTSRSLAVCDAFSAMTTERPYRAARSADEALAELRRCAGSQFDPSIVAGFVARMGATVTV
jgi:two-component system cell cycle response regulator